MPDGQEREALERIAAYGATSPGEPNADAMRRIAEAALAAQGDGITAWADHANRITEAERVIIDGSAYVPAIEAYSVVRDLQAMQGDGVLYEPREREDGTFRWMAAREDTERPDLRGQLEAAGLTDSEVDAVLGRAAEVVRDTERPDGAVVVREVGADDVRVGDVVWCGGWRTVAEVIPRGRSHKDSMPRLVFADSTHATSPFRGVLTEDPTLVRDTEQEHER